VNAGTGFLPIDLSRRDLDLQAVTAIAVFDREGITTQDYCSTMKRIAVPRHSLAGSKAQSVAPSCGRHPAYDALVNKVMGIITDPNQMATHSSPEQIAEVVYEAAMDGKDQLRYVAGADAKAMYAMRLQVGDEAFRNAIAQQFFGEAKAA